MSVVIEESGMRFGEYDDSQIFDIEHSQQYHEVQSYGASTCEFILLKDDTLYFIEAKSSCPRTVKGDLSEVEKAQKNLKYTEFIQEITQKMKHSIELYASILLKRQSQNGISKELCCTDLENKKIKMILVVNTHGAGWIPEPELQSKLQQQLEYVTRVWKTRPILVITEEKAREKHLII